MFYLHGRFYGHFAFYRNFMEIETREFIVHHILRQGNVYDALEIDPQMYIFATSRGLYRIKFDETLKLI